MVGTFGFVVIIFVGGGGDEDGEKETKRRMNFETYAYPKSIQQTCDLDSESK